MSPIFTRFESSQNYFLAERSVRRSLSARHPHTRSTAMDPSAATPGDDSVAALPLIHNDTSTLREDILPLIKHYAIPESPPHPYTPGELVMVAAEDPGQTRSTPELAVDARVARLFLSRHLAPRREGSFNFLALPAELRTTIYEFALSYPCLFLEDCPDSNSDLIQKELAPDVGIQDVTTPFRPTTQKMDELLAIVHVSKQLYREALPVVFSITTFRCPTRVRPVTSFACCARAIRSPSRQDLRSALASQTGSSVLRGSSSRTTPTKAGCCSLRPARWEILPKRLIPNL